MTTHVRETGERTFRTYRYLYESASRSLQHAKEHPQGNFYFLMSAGVFSAFTAEAYFNDLGPHVFTFWERLERLAPREKAEVLHVQLLGTSINWGERPFQSVADALRLRDRLAHGKTETKSFDAVRGVHDTPIDDGRGLIPVELFSDLEKSCDIPTIERFLADVRAGVERLCTAYDPEEIAFSPVFSMWTGAQSLISQEEADAHRRHAEKRKRARGQTP